MTSRARVLCLAGLTILAVAGCSSSNSSAGSSSGAAGPAAGRAGTCLSASSASSSAVAPSAAVPSGSTVARVPTQSLGCFDGSGVVRLDQLTRPAVISLWASYCVPCHVELPRLEAFAKAAGPSVAVIGVDTADQRSAAQSVITDLKLTFPMVFDPDQRVYNATAGRGLPATLFVAPGGQVRYVYESGTILDSAHLNALAKTYLGVSVHG